MGKTGPRVSALGLGAWACPTFTDPPTASESIATIHAALDAGMTLIDTGDFYGMGHNEMLIGEALAGGKRDKAVISVKFGAQRDPAAGWIGFDARPAAVKTFAAYTLRRLGTDHIDIYRPARLDPNVPIEDTVGAIADLVKAGLCPPYRPVRGRRRHHPPRRGGASDRRPADRIFADLARHRGQDPADPARTRHRRHRLWRAVARPDQRPLEQGPRQASGISAAHSPRFQGENLDQNLALVEALRKVAEAKDVSVAQIAIAWVAAQGKDIVPLVGARRRDRLTEALGALNVKLDAADLAAIEQAVPKGAAAGARYAEAQMASSTARKA